MTNPLIIMHALAGWMGILAFGWVAVELFRKPDKGSVARIHIASVLGLIAILFSWSMAGYYYVTVYGPEVKPLVIGQAEWAHAIGMETKEHLFLFLPFLAVLEVVLIKSYGTRIGTMRDTMRWVALAIVTLGILIAIEGHLISAAARAALEGGA